MFKHIEIINKTDLSELRACCWPLLIYPFIIRFSNLSATYNFHNENLSNKLIKTPTPKVHAIRQPSNHCAVLTEIKEVNF